VNGILAGVAAGCKCLAITTTAMAEELKAAGANMCISDYTMVTINDLQNL
jgi:beta-phosphoglucomutase-like phosphatase (HAD superfamily)